MKKLHLFLLTLILCVTGLGLAYYKIAVIGLPLTASEEAQVWNIEARISFRAKSDSAIKVTLPLPLNPAGYSILDEDFVSADYGLAIEQDNSGRVARWAKRRAHGKQLLFYRVVLFENEETARKPDAAPVYPKPPEYPEKLVPVIKGVLDKARQQSADTISFAQRVIEQLNSAASLPELKLLMKHVSRTRNLAKSLSWILAGARIPSRVIRGLRLQDNREYTDLEHFLQVYDGEQWHTLNIRDGREGLPADFIIWQTDDDRFFSIEGASESGIQYSVAKTVQETINIAGFRSAEKGSHLMEFSLYSLPVHTQNVYRVLLMVPLGALVVVFMRNIIGIRTFGTFMPILIAMAFRETELFWGLILFSLIVGLGLLLRAYVEQLKLLLVPRLAAVLTMVVLLMAGVSVIMHKLGFEMGLSVALFPMVIMTMTIERMSLTWEEAGPMEAFKQVSGSLLVAVMGYLAMSISELQYMFFMFPELLLVVLAAILLLGRYSGYRLMELWRFRAFTRNKP
ncbi:inactive transglutaminase family protein [Nitrosomonas sp.]|uniref:inactive transglutaminase family protein n=1 Tax=Nitrosomonas sp. TaxID=42353 RepID=UPI0025FD2E07|nr:inactive transglutaminase family protein [Nitrosomonas sp.]MCC6917310.1 inactive transglutaminase family protein [Nitrosomonas sp.]